MAMKIELMADYGCYPLWWANGEKVGDIDPATLPLSQETLLRLEKWADAYDAKLNWDDPASSGFASLETKKAFEDEGISLWHQLRKELVPEYEVFYFSNMLEEHITHPSQLEVLQEIR
ncbi:hypothetical protein [Kamptonema sp. UHCC 0994]|uniref:hypothetical protein n=1 Tax=Kamptonema sp. UHCC 0994 TaxID=3031329 RepID=UPI0023B9F771|nr:hypothetical protein [Kamptonema sp. UHCC 0994]MDF0554997.1 hypothetical protein [Kamptonema sp. UHCC 0994]